MQTSTSPVDPAIAQSRLIASRHPPGASTVGTSPEGRLQAGSGREFT
jgi:hypothetical protein